MDVITHTDAPPEASQSPRKELLPPPRKYAVELIGTFFLVFTIATSVLSASASAPPAIGFTVVTARQLSAPSPVACLNPTTNDPPGDVQPGRKPSG